MININSYLTFSGDCREAMKFYKYCIGGELTFQTMEESPVSENMPSQMKNSILHATLINGGVIIMASDMVSESGLTKGNAVSLMLNCVMKKKLNLVTKNFPQMVKLIIL